MKKCTIIALIMILCIVNVVPVFAYDDYQASIYAQKYCENSNSTYYEFDSDCTNFVSQCEATAGVISYMPRSFPSAPNVFSNLKSDSDSNVWYMVYRTRTIGKNYYLYSKTWSCVTDFREYFSKSNQRGSNSIASVRHYSISSWNTVMKNLKVGDILQYDENGYRHSIIISLIYGSTVKYCAHSTSRRNENISTFYNSLNKNGIKNFYVISFH